MNLLPEFKHFIPIQIRFSDIDKLGHVNNACYLNFFELGRVKYFNQVFSEFINWDLSGFVLARTEVDHTLPIYLNDEIFCATRIIKIGSKSLTVENSICKKEKGAKLECARGIGVLVAFDYTNKLSIEIPAIWKLSIEDFEGKKF